MSQPSLPTAESMGFLDVIDIQSLPLSVANFLVMANSRCQLDWAMGCPEIWPNIILGMSVKVFLDECNI